MTVDPTWDEVSSRLSATKATTAIALGSSPAVHLLIDPLAQAIAIVVPAGQAPLTQTTRAARGVRIQPQGPERIGVWVDEPALIRPGLDFLLEVARRVRLGEPVRDALDGLLEDWRALVAAIAETQMSAAVGVLGELAFLRSTLELGHDASCWVGMAGGAIDFRFGSVECEVKTTTGAHHEHVIHGADQLQPSVGADLVLVSIQIARAEDGHGTSILDLLTDLALLGVDRPTLESDLLRVRQVLAGDPAAAAGFVLRTAPTGFAVGPGFPALSSQAIAGLLGPEAYRVRDVSYRLSLDGLASTSDSSVVSLLANIRL